MGQRYQTKFFASQRNVSGDARPKFAAWSCAQYVNQPGAFSGASIQAAPAQRRGGRSAENPITTRRRSRFPGAPRSIVLTMSPAAKSHTPAKTVEARSARPAESPAVKAPQ